MKNISYEFNCGYHGDIEKVFIKNILLYDTVCYSYNKEWSKDKYTLKLSYIKKFYDCDGCITVDRDTDYYYFSSQEDCLRCYEDIKKILEVKKC